MAAEATAGLMADLASLPSWTLDDSQLADLEMLLSGAFAPLAGFMPAADASSVAESGVLADGTAWPVPVTLDVPAAAVPPGQRRLVLNDPEGVPLAVLDITDRSPVLVPPVPHPAGGDRSGRHARQGGPDEAGLVRLGGPVIACREPEHGPFRQLRRLPAEVRAELDDSPGLAFITRRPLNARQIGQLRYVAGQLRARLLLFPLVTGTADIVVRPEALVRAVLAAARHLPPGTLVVPLALAPRDTSADRELALRALVAAAYGATHLFTDEPAAPADPAAIPVVSAGDWAYDRAAEVWRPLALIEPGMERADLALGELEDLLDRGEEVPAWFTPPAVAAELRRARPPRSERGLVVFLTGLSGSGKSTIARGLRDALTERGDRTVSLLDGDLVRELLSAGLTFSRADRDLNIARIGFVATEVARHGGIAICAPIAPYAQARARVRAMAREVGDFLLIHVATPVQVCEARDRKGLYAKARAGLIGNFTGVSDPYEEPTDAELTIDTSVMSRQQSVEAVLRLLTTGGWLAGEQGRGQGGPG
ncbi:MAG TPA: adenylyl-sulfate kinase [Streptosporangiaceae bacterium]|nr:adenylyl-sulfate kinase [Streptosporangiaceae bacterium]